ncbi:MAG: TlpA family protein disulfide reductase [Spirochaetaceae bacterium]|nr:TlpA family protein disulfide reductase [Myxococcales bacterium]MCB9723749.1 TlpA family protein disulfide reductase [Spirochaetaceae bacterium]HPG25747.1 TlpA disulfide reductase family protein [Myxococcota bacterium]
MPGLVLGAAVVLVALILVRESDLGAPPVVRGADAPAFELPRLEESEGRLALSSLAGRVVLLNFWATWCEPCEREVPAMQRLYEALPRADFELVAVSIDDDPALVTAFRDRYRMDFPILLDRDQRVYKTYQTMGVPESLLIDRDGRIVERYVGPRDWDAPEYVERIRSLLEP